MELSDAIIELQQPRSRYQLIHLDDMVAERKQMLTDQARAELNQ